VDGMEKDFFEFMKKRDGMINIKHIHKRFPSLTKEQFLDGMDKWLQHKGMKRSERIEAIKAMDIFWVKEVEKYRNTKNIFGRKPKLQGW
jgi:hypothetical protein